MATYERRPLMSFKDKGGDKHLMYPITKAECVDGLDALLAGKETPSGAQEKVNIVQANLNTHATNSGMHVTSSEKAAWDAKESQTGAQGKVDAVRQELSSHKLELSPHASSIYRKGECLSDATKSLLGLAATAVPDAAFLALFIGANKYGFSISLNFRDGSPVKNKLISGLSAVSGEPLYSNDEGQALGVSTSSSPTIGVDFSDYVDVENMSRQLVATSKVSNVSLVTTNRKVTSLTISSSKTIKMSPAIRDYDISLVGGGGNGDGGYNTAGNNRGGGGGGSITNAFAVTNIGVLEILIGDGGHTGGTTSVSGAVNLDATGGNANGIGSSVNGGGANGARTAYPFNEAAIHCSGGGGNGGGYNANGSPGGSSYGGAGGKGAIPSSTIGSNGESGKGFGGGGGGGGFRENQHSYSGGEGYQGCVMLRWRYK